MQFFIRNLKIDTSIRTNLGISQKWWSEDLCNYNFYVFICAFQMNTDKWTHLWGVVDVMGLLNWWVFLVWIIWHKCNMKWVWHPSTSLLHFSQMEAIILVSVHAGCKHIFRKKMSLLASRDHKLARQRIGDCGSRGMAKWSSAPMLQLTSMTLLYITMIGRGT